MTSTQKDWWDGDSFIPGLSKNDLLLTVIVLGLLSGLVFSTNWDWVFGLRH